MKRRGRALALAVVLGALGSLALTGVSPAAPAQFSEFSIPTDPSRPIGITAGPDGNLWFTESWPAAHRIGRITPDGQITEFALPTGSANLNSITAGPDGNLWFTDGMSHVGRITPAGQITQFTIPVPPDGAMRQTRGIVPGPDGNLWFRMVYPDAIGKITTDGDFTEYLLPHAAGHPIQLAVGPDENIWFTLFEPDAIGRITTDGEITEFPVPTAGSLPHGITAGPDGNMWFVERDVDQIGRITLSGEITEFPLPHSERGAEEIVAGPDGNLWFTMAGAGRLGRVTTSGEVAEFLIPTGNSVPAGLTFDANGDLWFTQWLAGNVARFTPGPAVPENVHPPSITGNAVQGETLFASTGSWTNSPDSHSYQWQRCDGAGHACVAIEDADESSYALTADDVDHSIRVQVSATNEEGTGGPASSTATGVVVNPNAPGAPTIERLWVTDVKPTDATLHAEIHPHGLETDYEFHLSRPICPPPPPGGVTCMAIGNIDTPLPPGSIPAADHPVIVSVTVSETGNPLHPRTGYTYSVEATNAAGSAHSPSRRFRTPPKSTVIVDPILPQEPGDHAKPVPLPPPIGPAENVSVENVPAKNSRGCKRKRRSRSRNRAAVAQRRNPSSPRARRSRRTALCK